MGVMSLKLAISLLDGPLRLSLTLNANDTASKARTILKGVELAVFLICCSILSRFLL